MKRSCRPVRAGSWYVVGLPVAAALCFGLELGLTGLWRHPPPVSGLRKLFLGPRPLDFLHPRISVRKIARAPFHFQLGV
jgi:hypothetical protein